MAGSVFFFEKDVSKKVIVEKECFRFECPDDETPKKEVSALSRLVCA